VTNLVRQEIMSAADTVVVKVGSRVLTREDGTLDDQRVAGIADQLAGLRLEGRKPVLVSSGAVAAGMGRLGWKRWGKVGSSSRTTRRWRRTGSTPPRSC
jgi:glutamate 5-kinase